jgi:dTDP-4-dehydrorhamnose 3,5-epimerase-like enzyme
MADRDRLVFRSGVHPGRDPVAPNPINLGRGKKRRANLSLLGTKIVKLPTHADSRGCLIALDRDQSLPFEVRRVFCMSRASPKTIRGEHATSAHLALVALQGLVEVDLDNGRKHASTCLARTDEALCVHAGVWLRLRSFSSEAIVLVAASQLYANVVYFDRPQPELLKSIGQAAWQ